MESHEEMEPLWKRPGSIQNVRDATVRVLKVDAIFRMEIEDNGHGFNVEGSACADKPIRLGLLGMKERMEMIGGTFKIQSAPGGPTSICVEIPALEAPTSPS